MTLDTYKHVLPDMQEAAVKALERIFIAKIRWSRIVRVYGNEQSK
jgi:hypothetical protein